MNDLDRNFHMMLELKESIDKHSNGDNKSLLLLIIFLMIMSIVLQIIMIFG